MDGEKIMNSSKVENYIKETWEKTFRYLPEDQDTLIGLPYPYSIVGVKTSVFEEMYYWDTYFTNVGLLISGYEEQARNNVDDMLYLVERYGHMLNGNRTYYITRSQPPFLSEMVKDIYHKFADKEWLSHAYKILKKEYEFWQTRRMTCTGLNRYLGEDPDLDACAYGFVARLHIDQPTDPNLIREYGQSYQAGAESGWDFSSRCGLYNHKFNGVDLNALMYGIEKNMEYFALELENGEESIWSQAAQKRAERMNELMWNEDVGAFCDYDFEHQKQGDFISLAMFYPMFTQLATKEQAAKTVKLLDKMEREFGVACTENREDSLQLQWDFPHGWPCLQYLLIRALLNYGYAEDAKRIAKKYISVADDNFETTGQLWEKYDVLTGAVSVTKEYHTAPMMGWSAATYVYCKKLLSNL